MVCVRVCSLAPFLIDCVPKRSIMCLTGSLCSRLTACARSRRPPRCRGGWQSRRSTLSRSGAVARWRAGGDAWRTELYKCPQGYSRPLSDGRHEVILVVRPNGGWREFRTIPPLHFGRRVSRAPSLWGRGVPQGWALRGFADEWGLLYALTCAVATPPEEEPSRRVGVDVGCPARPEGWGLRGGRRVMCILVRMWIEGPVISRLDNGTGVLVDLGYAGKRLHTQRGERWARHS